MLPIDYIPAADCYQQIPYRRCGRSRLLLPALSLGLWPPFGTQQSILRKAFDLGISL